MISYSFSDNKNVPLYEQLYQKIRDDILAGNLESESRLPSKRSLARQLSISVITVENAYSQLVSEGYIYSEPKRGFFVSDIIPSGYATDYTTNVPTYESEAYPHHASSDSRDLVAYSSHHSSEYVHNTPDYFADFSSNANEPSSFPFATWAKLNRKILSEKQEILMTNSPSNGLQELRQAISDFLKGFRGLYVNPNNIIVGAGTETIYNILVQLLGYDKIYATEDPGYKKIALTLAANNVRTVRIPLDESGINPIYLEKEHVDVVHTTPSHHFPTGITMPIKRRYELLNWANDTGRYIIEDDYDSEFRLSGLPIPSLMSIDNNQSVIYMNTFTKSLASTIRISYMILPDHLMKLYHEKLSFYSCPVSTFEQLTLANFISQGYFEKHINRMRNTSRRKRDLLLNLVKSGSLADISEISEEQSGLHFLLKVHTSIDENSFIKACHAEGINISVISARSLSDETENELTCMINYSSIPISNIQEAVKRLENAIN